MTSKEISNLWLLKNLVALNQYETIIFSSLRKNFIQECSDLLDGKPLFLHKCLKDFIAIRREKNKKGLTFYLLILYTPIIHKDAWFIPQDFIIEVAKGIYLLFDLFGFFLYLYSLPACLQLELELGDFILLFLRMFRQQFFDSFFQS